MVQALDQGAIEGLMTQMIDQRIIERAMDGASDRSGGNRRSVIYMVQAMDDGEMGGASFFTTEQ